MRYCQLAAWDRAMMELDDATGFLSSSNQWVTMIDQEHQVHNHQPLTLVVIHKQPLLVMHEQPLFKIFSALFDPNI
jgi:hypothetical protein